MSAGSDGNGKPVKLLPGITNPLFSKIIQETKEKIKDNDTAGLDAG